MPVPVKADSRTFGHEGRRQGAQQHHRHPGGVPKGHLALDPKPWIFFRNGWIKTLHEDVSIDVIYKYLYYVCTYINLFSCSCIHLLIYLVIDVVILYMYLFYFLPGIYICIYIYTSIVKPQLNSPIDKMGMFLPQQMEDLLQNRWSIHGVTYIHFTQKMWMVASMECFEGTCAGRQWVVTIKEYQRLLLFPVNFLRPVFRDCWQLLIAAPLHQHFL